MKKALKLLTITLLIIGMLSGCASLNNTDEANTSTVNNESVLIPDSFPSKLNAEKVNSINLDDYKVCEGGIVYESSDGMYGIMSLDGKTDTGAKYTYCAENGVYFTVSQSTLDDDSSIDEMNCLGIVDINGKQLVPNEYCSLELLNNRYIKASKATGETDNKDNAVIYSTEELFSIMPSDEDTLYSGVWCVYDTSTGKLVPDATGTKPYRVDAYGNYITYTNDNNQQVIVNGNGEYLPSDANLLDDGSYVITKDGKGTVCDIEGNKLFDFDSETYDVYSASGEYFIFNKYDENAQKTIYFVFDKKGEKVSADFDYPFSVYGKFVFCDDELYDFDGNKVLDGKFTSVIEDGFTQNAFMLDNDDNTIVIDSSGKVIYNQPDNDDIYFSSSHFTSQKEINDEYYCYSFKDSDFTIKGSDIGYWTAESENSNGNDDVIDTISGEKIIENYDSYTCSELVNNSYYVYAESENGPIDVYLISI